MDGDISKLDIFDVDDPKKRFLKELKKKKGKLQQRARIQEVEHFEKPVS